LMVGGNNKKPAIIVMYDAAGDPVWYHMHGKNADSRGDVSADLLENNHVLIGPTSGEPPREVDPEGKIVWEGPANTGAQPMSHHAGKLSNGHYAVLREGITATGTSVKGTRIEELDSANKVIWSWNIFDHLTPGTGANSDWCHGNNATFNFEEDWVILNCRFLGAIKIKYSTSDVIWHMGNGFDPTHMGDFTYDPPAGEMSDAHDPEWHTDGSAFFYDNGGFDQAGGFAGSSSSDYHSRVVQYQIDEQAKKATKLWEFPGTFTVDPWFKNDWYSPYWGDADLLPNGNVLIDGAILSPTASSHIFEVRPSDGVVVWELVLPVNVGTYRAARIPALAQAYTP
jgi:Arylsulfotransferase (ASST)